MGNPTGEGELTTIHDRVNFYKDAKNDPGVHFKREGNNIALIDGDGTIINDKLIAKSEDAFNHEFDTYIPLKTKFNENQQIVLDYLKNIYSDVYEDCSPLETMYLFGSRRAWNEESELTEKEEFQVLAAFAEWGTKEVAE